MPCWTSRSPWPSRSGPPRKRASPAASTRWPRRTSPSRRTSPTSAGPRQVEEEAPRRGAAVHDTFEPYAAAFKRQFGISGNQAMELFHRTVSMKQVENITSFVRTNMLEDDDVGDAHRQPHPPLRRPEEGPRRRAPGQGPDRPADADPGRCRPVHAQLSREDDLARQQRDQLHPWFTDRQLQLSLEHQRELERHRGSSSRRTAPSCARGHHRGCVMSFQPSRRTSAPTAAAGWPRSTLTLHG